MRTSDINIRDPYVLPYEGKYYMYGTRSATCWGPAEGFDCYVSADMENWEGPIEIFHRPEGFFADRSYWAPECYYYDGNFYLVTTLEGDGQKKGIYILKATTPTGPFDLYSGRVTPEEWACIDGTLYIEGERPYLIFSHSFEDNPNGDMCLLELSADLRQGIGEPIRLFSATETPWAHPVPFAKEEMGMDGDIYFTDGPCLVKHENGSLCMTWSSWGTKGYAVGQAISASGDIAGPWQQSEELLFPENGGHGMVFQKTDGELCFVLHYPNDKYAERPLFKRVVMLAEGMRLE